MKKIFLFGVLGCLALGAQAKVLRVSNATGSNAPYTTYEDAEAAAAEGDTIVFDGSDVSYGDITVKSKVVLMGRGYDLIKNGITFWNSSETKFGTITLANGSAGTIVQGLYFGTLSIRTDSVVVTRCKGDYIRNGGGYEGYYSGVWSNIVIHQNMIGSVSGYAGSTSQHFTNCQITNNIFRGYQNYSGLVCITGVRNAIIHYNTFASCSSYGLQLDDVIASSVKYNSGGNESNGYWATDGKDENSVSDNYMPGDMTRFKDLTLDSELMTADYESIAAGYGAFAGTDPYVISGVPAGPVIEDVTMPVSVEQGKPLEVTVKVKIQQ